jgi:hypothetical protein
MSWLYSQALVDAYLGENFLDGEPSAPSNGNPTPQAYLSPDKMTDFSRLSRFGMTYKPLTEDHGAAVLTSFLAAFPARTSVLREKELESQVSGQGCGPTWRASLARFDPATFSWKTAQLSLLGESESSSVIWPRSGMTVDGECWELPMLEPTTSATGSGWWPTPTVCGNYNRKGASATSGDGLATAVRMWPTPTAHNSKETNAPSEANRNTPTLAAQAGGKLNPMWVEWLMGWPLGWTDLKPLETDKFHCAPQQHGES